jgi:hypothetical protein
MNLLRSLFFVSAATLVISGLFTCSPAVAQAHDHKNCNSQEVTPLGENVTGHANLCILPQGIRGSMKARGLTPGDAYTLWLVYIDDPTVCDPSTLDCFDDADPQGVFGRFDSTVGSGDGNFTFLGRVDGMKPSHGSLFFLLLYAHGPADYDDGRKLARQLLTPEDPDAGAPHLGNIIDGPGFVPAAIAVYVVP